MAKIAMATKTKIITAIVVVICFAGLAIGIYFLSINFGTIKTAVSESQQVFTKEQLEAAKLEAYNEALGERKQYEDTIAALQKQLVEERAAWQKKYSDMVAEKDAEIERLTQELTSNVAYMRELEKYIMDYFQISLPEGQRSSRAVLDLQLSAFRTIKTNLEAQKTHFEENLNNLPNEEILRSDITARQSDVDFALSNLRDKQRASRKLNWVLSVIKLDLYYDGSEHAEQKLYKSLEANVGSFSITLNNDPATGEALPVPYTYIFTFTYDNSTGVATASCNYDIDIYNLFGTWHNEYKTGLCMFPELSYKKLIEEPYKVAVAEENTANTSYENAKANLELAQARLESTIGERAVAETMIGSATSGIEQAKERITELEAKIAELEASQPEQGTQEQGGTKAPDPTVTA